MGAPSLAARSLPGLTETLTGPRDPRQCQACGAHHCAAAPLSRWLEHDPWDKVPDQRPAVVVLCRRDADVLIEPHPRLYTQLANYTPFPGCMGLCIACLHRDGVSCTSPEAKVNGGPGINVEFSAPPTRMHIYCGGRRGRSGWVTEYPGPAIRCSARQAVAS